MRDRQKERERETEIENNLRECGRRRSDVTGNVLQPKLAG
jgi:hypothetical protein